MKYIVYSDLFSVFKRMCNLLKGAVVYDENENKNKP